MQVTEITPLKTLVTVVTNRFDIKYIEFCLYNVRVGGGKSLARPGRKQATATKLGIYSTSPHEAQYTS